MMPCPECEETPNTQKGYPLVQCTNNDCFVLEYDANTGGIL